MSARDTSEHIGPSRQTPRAVRPSLAIARLAVRIARFAPLLAKRCAIILAKRFIGTAARSKSKSGARVSPLFPLNSTELTQMTTEQFKMAFAIASAHDVPLADHATDIFDGFGLK